MTTTTANPTYPISPMILTRNTAELRQRVAKHIADDAVRQGIYWDGSKGNLIGCLNHSANPSGAAHQYGLPIAVQRLAQSIFKAMPTVEAVDFFAALPDAVACDGKDLSCVVWQFMATELRNLPPQSAAIQAVIDPVIAGMDLLAAGKEWPPAAARAAAEAANAAYEAAAMAAGEYAAANATWAAAEAADASADAHRAAWAIAEAAFALAEGAWAAAGGETEAAWQARAAARRRQRDLLLQLISDAPVV